MGILQALGLSVPRAAPSDAKQDDALAAAKKKYEDDKRALEEGDLKKVPAKAPVGVESLHAAVLAARKALPVAPKTASDYVAASKALDTLAKRVAAYLAGEAAAIAHLKARFDAEKRALDGDLLKLPLGPAKGLEAAYGAVTSAQGAMPADPKTVDEYVAAIKALPALKRNVAAYLKAEAKKKIVDEGLGEFGSSGSKLNELEGHEKLNDEQMRILDAKLGEKLAASAGAIPEKELKKIAQKIVEKTNKLAETPLEKKIPGINEKLAKSETLKTNIVKLQAANWKIKVNAPGKGSFCDKVNKTIAIDPSDPLDEALGGLAHETGHALFSPPPKPTVKDSASGVEYVRKCTEVDFIDEGEAQFMACRATTDLKAKGVDAKVPADGGEFMAIYVKFTVGQLTEDAARKEMAKQFGKLITSTTKESYLIYYGRGHIETWNSAHKKDAAQQLDQSILATMTLFP
jgi:hypothetical protein